MHVVGWVEQSETHRCGEIRDGFPRKGGSTHPTRWGHIDELVMAGLVPAIHAKAAVVQRRKTWMAGTRPSAGPAMTQKMVAHLRLALPQCQSDDDTDRPIQSVRGEERTSA